MSSIIKKFNSRAKAYVTRCIWQKRFKTAGLLKVSDSLIFSVTITPVYYSFLSDVITLVKVYPMLPDGFLLTALLFVSWNILYIAVWYGYTKYYRDKYSIFCRKYGRACYARKA